jgi:Lrp/AsnC family transcriptional regulator, regulator for asnA, asnC and gidA
MNTLCQKDLMIISKLRDDSRMKLTKLSKETKIPVSTIFDKIKEFKPDFIKKFSCVIDFEKLGFPVKSKLMLQVNVEDRERLKNFLKKKECVNSVFRINNGFNFLIEGIFKNIRLSEQFIEKIEEEFKVTNLLNFYVFEEIKKEEFQLIDDYACI